MSERRGTTLAELLVVVALGAVIGSIAMVAVPRVVHGLRLAGTARTVASALRLARGQALSGGAPIEAWFDRAAPAVETRDGGGAVLARHALPGGVTITGMPVRGRVSFSGLGTAENGTLALGAGGVTRGVVVNQRGRVRVQ